MVLFATIGRTRVVDRMSPCLYTLPHGKSHILDRRIHGSLRLRKRLRLDVHLETTSVDTAIRQTDCRGNTKEKSSVQNPGMH